MVGIAVVGLAGQAEAESPSGHRPDRSGVLIVVTTATTGVDNRARSLAGGFVAKGLESFVAHEMTSPGPDADRRIEEGRRRLEDAQLLRGDNRIREAARAADDAIRLLAGAATQRRHLELLVAALLERGTHALLLQDPATAETVFLEALAIEPEHEPDRERYPESARRLFIDVRRAAHQLRFATLVLDAPRLAGAEVEVDFLGPRVPPYTVKLPEGRHFVSVTAPGRVTVVAPVAARAERQQRVELFPPLEGDGFARQLALSQFDAGQPATVVALSQAAGLRFLVASRLDDSQVHLQMYDGRTGQAVSSGQVTLSAQPGPAEISAGVEQLMQAILLADPDALEQEGGSWYGTWWGITLIGVVVAGAAAGTAVALTRGGDTEYRFEP